ncbi:hypothetical protein AALP_AA5G284900, partial [Arabis alpina]
MDKHSSNDSDIDFSALTMDKAFENRLKALNVLNEDQLILCTRVSVEGYDTSLRRDDIKRVLLRYFRSCGDIFRVLFSRDRPGRNRLRVSRRACIYFRNEGAQDKAVALSGSNVGFPIPGIQLGGWNVFVKAIRKLPVLFSPDEVAEARRIIHSRDFGFIVKGFPTNLPANVVKMALFRRFRSYGEIRYLTIDEDRSQPGLLHTSGFVSLWGDGDLEKSEELDGTDMGGWNLSMLTLAKALQTPVSHDSPAYRTIGPKFPPGIRCIVPYLPADPWGDHNTSTASSSDGPPGNP